MDASGVAPGDQELGGVDGADPGFVEEVGCDVGDVVAHGVGELADPGVELGDGAGLSSQGQFGGGDFTDRLSGRVRPESGTALDQPGAAGVGELCDEGFWAGHQGGLETIDQRRTRPDQTAAGTGQRPDRSMGAIRVGSWGHQLGPAQDLASGPNGVEMIRLRAISCGRSRREREIDHPFPGPLQRSSQSRPVAARAFHGPRPVPGISETVGPCHCLIMAIRVVRKALAREFALGGRVDRGHLDPCLVGIDPDDTGRDLCQHRHTRSLPSGWWVCSTGLRSLRQDCDESRPTGRTGS